MAKFFQKKEKQDRSGSSSPRLLNAEEEKKAGNLKLNMTKDQLRGLAREMGVSEEKIRETLPDPLPEAEQQKKIQELRRLFSSNRYDEVITAFVPVSDKGLLSGDAEDECNFAIGFSGIKTKNKLIIERFGPLAVYYLRQIMTKDTMVNTFTLMLQLVTEAEAEVPGCMRGEVRILYAWLNDRLGDNDPLVREFKKYI